MKKTNIITTLLLSLMMISSFLMGEISPRLDLNASAVSVKLVLGKDGVLSGYTGVDDITIFHENVVTYVGEAGSALPTPTKTGTSFVSWVYAQSSELKRVSLVPYTSGAILFAYWVGDGSLATSISGSSSSSSSCCIQIKFLCKIQSISFVTQLELSLYTLLFFLVYQAAQAI